MRFALELDDEMAGDLAAFVRVARFFYEGVVYWNQLVLEAHPGIPLLSEAGIHYEPKRMTEFPDILTILGRGWGSCGHLSCWRVAELRNRGERAEIVIRDQGLIPEGQLFHVLVHTRHGYEDPSIQLGMKV